jgi:hypothetical protein
VERDPTSGSVLRDAIETGAFCYFFFFGAAPIPDSPTDCGAPVALSEILRLPVSAVVSSTGVKMTATLHFLPGRQRLVALRFCREDRWRRAFHLDAHCGALGQQRF